ncbi:MAG: adenosine kinase [Alphaproteobacteria bacterium]
MARTTTETTRDVVGIGNAIIDILAHADEAFLGKHALTKGAMNLVDDAFASRLYESMPPAVEASGGSCANTMAGVASFGGKAGYIGKVRDDDFGRIFRHDIRAIGVDFETAPSRDGAPTARSLILITPDAQRTMHTYLGACVELGPDDVDPAFVQSAQITYLEGYLWDPPAAKQALLKAAEAAHAARRKVSLTLSDPFCVERHRDSFRDLIAGHIDVLFANEAEILSLYRVKDFADAVAAVRLDCTVAALTRSEKGSVVVAGDTVIELAAEPIEHLVDTTGAGDQYAAGFLFGYARGRPLAECGRLGGLAAAEVIGHLGPRPDRPLSDLLAAVEDAG